MPVCLLCGVGTGIGLSSSVGTGAGAGTGVGCSSLSGCVAGAGTGAGVGSTDPGPRPKADGPPMELLFCVFKGGYSNSPVSANRGFLTTGPHEGLVGRCVCSPEFGFNIVGCT